MTQSDIDNDLARFLGPEAIPDEERSSMKARLAADDEAMSQAADAAAVLRELEAEDGIVVVDETADNEPPRVREANPAHTPKVVTPPPSTRRTWRRPPARWLALAAMLAGVMLVFPPRFGGRGPVGPGEIAASLTNRQEGFPEDWPPAWGSTRSGSGVVVADDNALAARLGALHMQLELAVAARQADKTQAISRVIATTLGAVTAGGTVSPIYSDIARDSLPQDTLAQLLADGREYLPRLVGEEHFALGAWAEAARLAARQRDEEFFRIRASRRMLDRAASVPSPEDATRTSVKKIRAALAPDEPNWTALRLETDQLLRSLTS